MIDLDRPGSGPRRRAPLGLLVGMVVAVIGALSGLIFVMSQGVGRAPATAKVSAVPTVVTIGAMPTLSQAPSLTYLTPNEVITSEPSPTPSVVTLAPDACPAGDFSGNVYDGSCGTAPAPTSAAPAPDSCPNGDYSGSAFDGSCGTRPVPTRTQPAIDVCPNGDVSGSPTDGSCGTMPTVVVTSCRLVQGPGSQGAEVVARVTNPDHVRFKLTLTVSGDSQGLPPSNADGKDFSYVSKKAKVAEACSARLTAG